MMRKLMVVIILFLFIVLLLIPSKVRAALVNRNNPIIFQQVASAYPDGESTSTDALSTAYPIETGTPPTASFGTATQSGNAAQTPTFTPTRTQTTGFVTATSSYANTAAAIRTISALTLEAATRNSPLYTPGLNESITPTFTSTSMPSWTPSPSFTSYPTVITTPRVLLRGEWNSPDNLQSLLIGFGTLGITCFLIVGIWYFRKKP